MKKAAVIYWSGTGNTEAMANAVLEGMKSLKRGRGASDRLRCGWFRRRRI